MYIILSDTPDTRQEVSESRTEILNSQGRMQQD